MARFGINLLLSLVFLFEAASVSAQEHSSEILKLVDDKYISGSNLKQISNLPRNLFITGFSIIVDGRVAQDSHIAGFDVEVSSETGKDLYVAGASISIDGMVGQDLTAAGFSIRLKKGAIVNGNTRIAAGNLILDAPLNGDLIIAGGDIVLNSAITGDVKLTASEINFGENAKIDGKFTYYAPEEIEIPSSVISLDRVEYRSLKEADLFDDLIKSVDHTESFLWLSLIGIISSFIIGLVFLILIAAIFLSYKPELVEELRNEINSKFGRTLLLGLIGLAVLFGLFPVAAMTLIGIPAIPIVLLLFVCFWILGYLLGTYAVFWRIMSSMGVKSESITIKLVIVGVGLISLSLIQLIPILGWLINLTIVLLGLGAISKMLIKRTAT